MLGVVVVVGDWLLVEVVAIEVAVVEMVVVVVVGAAVILALVAARVVVVVVGVVRSFAPHFAGVTSTVVFESGGLAGREMAWGTAAAVSTDRMASGLVIQVLVLLVTAGGMVSRVGGLSRSRCCRHSPDSLSLQRDRRRMLTSFSKLCGFERSQRSGHRLGLRADPRTGRLPAFARTVLSLIVLPGAGPPSLGCARAI